MQWYSGSIPQAVAEAKQRNKLFLVYIEGTNDLSKSMTDTYNDVTIAQKLSPENVVALKLAANSVPYVQFCAIYPVLFIPSSYFIGVNGAPIEIVTGSLSPAEFSAKIDNIFQVHVSAIVNKKVADPSQPSSSKDSTSSVLLKESSPDLNSLPSNPEDSGQPSTSNSADDAEKVALDDRVERAKQLLEVKKQIKEQEEKEKEKKQELERRSVGKALQKIKQDQTDKELEEWAKSRAKDKEEERIARQKVLDMIAQDRAERAARFQQHKDSEQAERDRLAKIREEQERAARNAAFNSNEAHIQLRLPDGSSRNNVFSANATLEDVRNFIIKEVRPPFSYFSLCTTFPRRHFTPSNNSESLRDLQLAPSAVLLILPGQAISGVNSSGNFLINIFWMLMSPLTSAWNFIMSFFRSTSTSQNREDANPPPSSEPSTSQPKERGSSETEARQRNNRFSRREGNIYRLSNQSDDDENNTWNGNSTQQM